MTVQASYILLATLGVVSAHSIMNRISAGDTIACNGPPVTYFTSSTQVISVAAGETVTGAWLHTLTSTGAESEADNKSSIRRTKDR